jgi:tetratricopeptide (TPR) repeat protein
LTLSAIGEYQSAICEFKKVIKLDKSNAHAHNHLGLLYAQMKQFEKAAKYLLAAIELEKTNNQFLVDYNFVNKQIERLKKGEKNLPGEFKVKQPDIISQHAFTDSILEKLSNVFVTFLILPKKYEMSRSILYPIKTKQYLYPTIFRTVG